MSDYFAHIRSAALARKPLNRAEWQFLGVYAGLVAITLVIALVTKH